MGVILNFILTVSLFMYYKHKYKVPKENWESYFSNKTHYCNIRKQLVECCETIAITLAFIFMSRNKHTKDISNQLILKYLIITISSKYDARKEIALWFFRHIGISCCYNWIPIWFNEMLKQRKINYTKFSLQLLLYIIWDYTIHQIGSIFYCIKRDRLSKTIKYWGVLHFRVPPFFLFKIFLYFKQKGRLWYETQIT